MKKCAYCNATNSKLTREHIWPCKIIEKCESLLTYNPRNEKFHKHDPIIKDVCEQCNNTHLSGIDVYLAGIFDNFFVDYIEAGNSAEFAYDYNSLIRGLMKISYNSVRSTDNEKQKKLLARFAKQIILGGAFPSIMVRLQIVTTSNAVTLLGDEVGVLRPDVLRCGVIAYTGRLSSRFCIRLVGFRSYWFYVIIPYKNEPQHIWKELLENLENWETPMGVLLSPTATRVSIPASKTAWVTPTLLGKLSRGLEELEL
jgi:hypothetical protein